MTTPYSGVLDAASSREHCTSSSADKLYIRVALVLEMSNCDFIHCIILRGRYNEFGGKVLRSTYICCYYWKVRLVLIVVIAKCENNIRLYFKMVLWFRHKHNKKSRNVKRLLNVTLEKIIKEPLRGQTWKGATNYHWCPFLSNVAWYSRYFEYDAGIVIGYRFCNMIPLLFCELVLI